MSYDVDAYIASLERTIRSHELKIEDLTNKLQKSKDSYDALNKNYHGLLKYHVREILRMKGISFDEEELF